MIPSKEINAMPMKNAKNPTSLLLKQLTIQRGIVTRSLMKSLNPFAFMSAIKRDRIYKNKKIKVVKENWLPPILIKSKSGEDSGILGLKPWFT